MSMQIVFKMCERLFCEADAGDVVTVILRCARKYSGKTETQCEEEPTCFSHQAMPAVFISRKVFMAEAIARDRLCTRRHDAELCEKDGEVNMHRQHLGAFSLHDRTQRPEAENGVRGNVANDAACGGGGGRSFGHVMVPPYP